MAANEKPGTWVQWKAQHRWPWLTSFEWVLRWLMYWCHGSATFWFLEVAGWIATVASVVVAAYWWVAEADDRQIARQNAVKEKHYRAWELINSARDLSGDGGRRDALQDLNEDHVNLSGAPLANAYLFDVKLPGAQLSNVNLNNAILPKANLANANLRHAKLAGAYLNGANLSGADLENADFNYTSLTNANLVGANLAGASFRLLHLYEANLTGANLTGADLNAALFCNTIMPDGTINNRDCRRKSATPGPSETPPAPN
jgi:hypothetical protein